MTAEQSTLLSHPLTITVLVIVSGAIGWILATLIGLIKDNSTLTQIATDTKELLSTVIKSMDEHRTRIDGIEKILTELFTEHRILSQEHQKKKHPE